MIRKTWPGLLLVLATFANIEGANIKKKSLIKTTKQQVIKSKSAYDYYHLILSSHQNKDWKSVIQHCKSLLANYKDSPFNAEACYYKGIAYFHLGDFDMANSALSQYLKVETTPKYFEEALDCKFRIGEKFYEGAKKHILGLEKLPKIVPAKDEALEIFEQIIITLPRHDLTAKSLYKKAVILTDFEDYKESVEAFQVLIRRFPKHYLTPEAFLGIQKVYLKQSQLEFPDPDILELAEINIQRFKDNFPSDERIENAKKMFSQMQDCFAKELFETASFYERTKKYEAAIFYHESVISQYPESSFALKSHKQIETLSKIPLASKKQQ